ncbi:MAG: hypothetical protein ABFC62_01585 [Clostridiaceae bacterium]
MFENRRCILCEKNALWQALPGKGEQYKCPKCGIYEVSREDYEPPYYAPEAKTTINNENKHILAGYLFEHNQRKSIIDLSPDEVARIISQSPRTSVQKLEKLLLSAYRSNNMIGHKFDSFIPSEGYAKSEEETDRMVDACIELGWFKRTSASAIAFTIKGLQRAEELLSTNIGSKKVFVAMGFAEDLIMACEKAIKPACAACGFDAFLITDTEYNSGITDEIIAAIKQSHFVVVDLTYGNQGAYWEAGYAQGLGREVIRCVKKDWFDEDNKRLHFDVRHYNTILWKDHADFARQLKARIRATVDGATFED